MELPFEGIMAADECARLNRRLAELHEPNRTTNTLGKAEFIQNIIAKAQYDSKKL